MAQRSPELRTFLDMQRTIKGHITNSLDTLCFEAVSKDMMELAEKSEIMEGGGGKHRQCTRFLDYFNEKIEVTPAVFDDFVKLLGTLRTCDGVVKQMKEKLELNLMEQEQKEEKIDLPDAPQKNPEEKEKGKVKEEREKVEVKREQ